MANKKTVPISSARKEGKPMAATEKDFSRITLRDKEGNAYTLEFNARVVKRMQRNGAMKLIHVCEIVKEVLELTGFADILDIES